MLVFSCFDVRQRIAAFIIAFSLLYCSFTDYFYGLIPDRTHLLMIIGAFMMLKTGEFSSSILFSVAVFIVFSFIALISKGMGFGDVKLISCLALVLSPYSLLVCIAIASCSAVISVLPIIIIRHLKKTVEIPFGPFLSISAIVCLFFLQ